MNKRKKETFTSKIFVTIIGGMGLFVASIVLNAFISSPPTRAEYDSFKATITTQNKSIDRRLNKLEDGQERIINLMISKEKNHGKSVRP